MELATASISSPGLEYYLQLTTEQAVTETEAGLVGLIEGLKYANLADRGYLDIQFSHNEVTARFVFVDSIKAPSYSLLAERSRTLNVSAGANELA